MAEYVELPSFWQTIRAALRLDPAIYLAVQSARGGIWVALAVVALASFSEAVGQSVVLFINRVRPVRFVLSLGISTLSNLFGYLLWTVTVWLLARYVFGVQTPLLMIASAVGLAYAPQILSIIELTPWLGGGITVVLTLWSAAAVVVAVEAGAGLSLWQAVGASALGWAAIQLFRQSLGRPIYRLGAWLKRRVAGAPLTMTLADLRQLSHTPDLARNWQEWRRRVSRSRATVIERPHSDESASAAPVPAPSERPPQPPHA